MIESRHRNLNVVYNVPKVGPDCQSGRPKNERRDKAIAPYRLEADKVALRKAARLNLTEARKYLVELMPCAGEVLKKYFASGDFKTTEKAGVDFTTLFIEKAGGRISTPIGEPWNVFHPGMIASNGILHDDILNLING